MIAIALPWKTDTWMVIITRKTAMVVLSKIGTGWRSITFKFGLIFRNCSLLETTQVGISLLSHQSGILQSLIFLAAHEQPCHYYSNWLSSNTVHNLSKSSLLTFFWKMSQLIQYGVLIVVLVIQASWELAYEPLRIGWAVFQIHS